MNGGLMTRDVFSNPQIIPVPSHYLKRREPFSVSEPAVIKKRQIHVNNSVKVNVALEQI